jgi:hypothetical protein
LVFIFLVKKSPKKKIKKKKKLEEKYNSRNKCVNTSLSQLERRLLSREVNLNSLPHEFHYSFSQKEKKNVYNSQDAHKYSR